MAKAYEFRIQLQQAERSNGFVSVCFGGADTRYGTVDFTGTLAEALAKRAEVSKAESRPHVALLSMRNRNDRKPPGFDAATDPIHFGGEG